MTTFNKAPSGNLDYTMDWADWLDGDLIGTSLWIVPSGMTQVSSGIDSPATSTTVWLTGGVKGAFYEVKNRVTTNTSPARVATRSIYIEVG